MCFYVGIAVCAHVYVPPSIGVCYVTSLSCIFDYFISATASRDFFSTAWEARHIVNDVFTRPFNRLNPVLEKIKRRDSCGIVKGCWSGATFFFCGELMQLIFPSSLTYSFSPSPYKQKKNIYIYAPAGDNRLS
ncbi:hypothetical protein, unlikely [Trypanosoma brucei gambiense DAL972]|uniref:Uncharacterized protein n=1 Tax=Trypanosoma brucei gambiense (strain MHOM/CI/86/DAL972) TaxID=679716 RepID=C9ZM77_TRYB9|nr:hypothetical protein, unlikely [Trypanosoma brucei gambiense DAL972]CBH10750.1 hypothetical protein, unlikely [Trypanosoma brucei gambiense DAL972]|eukprot:XP_011773038.1 hypothetical protein, unlikely [Trypanosoma brucei gambiense DAL972]